MEEEDQSEFALRRGRVGINAKAGRGSPEPEEPADVKAELAATTGWPERGLGAPEHPARRITTMQLRPIRAAFSTTSIHTPVNGGTGIPARGTPGL